MLSNESRRLWQERNRAWRQSQAFDDWQDRRRRRDEVRPEMRDWAEQFVTARIDLAAFREVYNAKAYGDWDCFGLRGSAMFLNLLCKYVGDVDGVTRVLRQALPVPASMEQARARIAMVADFLEQLITTSEVERGDVHPNRVVPFLTSWWQVQDPSWIAYARTARRVLLHDGLLEIGHDRAENYVPYVDLMNELASALDSDLEDVEGLCTWLYEQPKKELPEDDDDGDDAQEQAGPRIWLLAPGRGASAWEEHYAAGVAAIGWQRLGDLRQYNSLEEVNARLRVLRGNDRNPFHAAHACFNFAYRMRPGDIIFAKRGRYEIIGAGVVTGEYEYDPNHEQFVHRRSVTWTHNDVGQPRDKTLVTKTLTEITAHTGLVRACAEVFGTTIEDIARAAGRPIQVEETTEEDTETVVELKTYTAEDALAELFVDKDDLDDMLELLRARRNVVLQGPPGTGKTFLAACLARVLIGSRSEKQICRVQFHQSMTYEDFVQGYRPDGTGFALRTGPFLRFCNEALQDLENPYVLIIDEINRGNLSRILGELMLLIEHDKRGPEWAVTLAYADADDEPTWVPPNLHIIGTMNTADRSLALVDYALRRRFAFIDVASAVGHHRFREHLAARGVDPTVQDWIVERVTALNRHIRNDANLGWGFTIGHSYFCGKGTDEIWYERVIRHEIVPLLREYWFDAPERVKEMKAKLGNGD